MWSRVGLSRSCVRCLVGDRPRPVLICRKPSKVQQHFRQESDVNEIMRRYRATGVLPGARRGVPVFGDFSDGIDFLEAQERVVKAREAFESLPAEVRRRFRNDPAELLEFISDESNRDEAEQLGLVVPRVEVKREGEAAGASEGVSGAFGAGGGPSRQEGSAAGRPGDSGRPSGGGHEVKASAPAGPPSAEAGGSHRGGAA